MRKDLIRREIGWRVGGRKRSSDCLHALQEGWRARVPAAERSPRRCRQAQWLRAAGVLQDLVALSAAASSAAFGVLSPRIAACNSG